MYSSETAPRRGTMPACGYTDTGLQRWRFLHKQNDVRKWGSKVTCRRVTSLNNDFSGSGPWRRTAHSLSSRWLFFVLKIDLSIAEPNFLLHSRSTARWVPPLRTAAGEVVQLVTTLSNVIVTKCTKQRTCFKNTLLSFSLPELYFSFVLHSGVKQTIPL